MRINIIGGGPAGLYFALLMKQTDPAHDITIFERNGPDDTFGWGVVFSGKTLANLRAADPVSHGAITANFREWDNVDIVHRDSRISVHGNSFTGIARIELLKILQRRAQELNVDLRFRHEVSDIESLRRDSDLLVGADGVSSAVRRTYEDEFKPTLDVRANHYIWYGTHRLFHGLTLTFRENNAGVFSAHSYKFNQDTSTFIVECDPITWTNAEFDRLSDRETRAYLEQVFATDLEGHELLTNNSKWINFVLVRNQNWHFKNVVLLGDALHTAHFSIGSGTKLAIEDSIALAAWFQQERKVSESLAAFESARKPVIEDYQSAAFDSMVWFENAREYMHLSPLELAFSAMMRSGRVSNEDLKKRDPNFIRQVELQRSANN